MEPTLPFAIQNRLRGIVSDMHRTFFVHLVECQFVQKTSLVPRLFA